MLSIAPDSVEAWDSSVLGRLHPFLVVRKIYVGHNPSVVAICGCVLNLVQYRANDIFYSSHEPEVITWAIGLADALSLFSRFKHPSSY